MATFAEFAGQAPELAAKLRARLAEKPLAYLATVREDGAPRVHPVTPILSANALFVFMEPTSPKGHDLRRDGRYALHSAVDDNDGGGGEYLIEGRATAVDDPAIRDEAATASPYSPAERYILFTFAIERVLFTHYPNGQPQRERWKAAP